MQAVRYTHRHKGIKCIGIRDEESSASVAESIFAYPSNEAPEKEVFCNQCVSEFLLTQYGINFADILTVAKDHHEYANQISRQCEVDKSTIEVQCIQAYVSSQDGSKFASLISNIRKQC